ncbi:winged helix-turn-helix domain-containing protein [Neobacillus drentensis]|uniref:winged helix-turn-helix domain-containing protein n=1 Tax=Neobacillus drentensis TaxID=220684 RepID=UPI0008260855|nr:winged helix-turn-helix domain-containing protein [Neobacillus drentensis]
MAQLHFHPSNLQVSFHGKTVTLLPKEFSLLQFLHTHPNQGLSREALLDAVWPLEAPVDRTVDDHIYRLRKKLKIWNQFILIETVRGVGYRLTYLNEKGFIPPSIEDKDFNSQFSQIISKYHLFGQGESMQVVADQQKVLGVNLSPFYLMYMEIIKGNWKVLLDEKIPYWNRAYFMIVLYSLLEDDPAIGCNGIEKMLQKNNLETAQKWELQGLDLVFFLIWDNQIEKASQHIDWALEMVSKHQLDTFHIVVSLTQVYVLLHQSLEKAKEKLLVIENLLKDKPYLRERSHFEIAKGIFQLKNKEYDAGKQSINKGIEIMKSTKFELQLFYSITHVYHLLRQYAGEKNELCSHYKNLRINVFRKFDGDLLKNSLKNQLHSFL